MDRQLRQSVSLANPIHFLALGFGSGLAPKAPGTFGSLAAIPLVWLLAQFSLPIYLIVTILACVLGVWLCHVTAEDMGVHDHPAIVWDEVAGMLLTFVAIVPTWQHLLAGFALFRLFDILKPWPIKLLDKQVHGGLGIMVDDLLAGVFAWVCLWGLITLGWLS